MTVGTTKEKLKLILSTCLILSVLAFFAYGAALNAVHVNVDDGRTDQGAYLSFAKKSYETKFKYSGGRNRMPLYPWIQALFYSNNLSQNEFFVQAKMVSIFISMILLILISIAASIKLSILGSVSFSLISAFGVFIFRAAYVQAEPLFYALFFLSILASIKMLVSRKIIWAFSAGTLLAITHYSKASTPPILLLVFVMIIFLLLNAFILKNNGKSESQHFYISNISLSRATVLLGTFLFVYLMILAPYLKESNRNYGKFFYNVNSTFYIWYDSWEEAKKGTRAHGDRKGWPKMPAEEIPSISRYLKTHSAEDIGKRVFYGFKGYIKKIFQAEHFEQVRRPILYSFFYIISAAILLIRAGRLNVWLNHGRAIVLVFYFFMIFGYSIIAAWLSYITIAPRYVGFLCIPLIFFSILIIEWVPLSTRKLVVYKKDIDIVKIFHLFIILWILLIDAPRIVFQLMPFIYFGN